jgi:transketolase|tara:strand:+ start:1617 stop:2393 length:777 start_codon:yes stop_codon:yes gene_type:complete
VNNDLRIKIVEMVTRAREGHIPSSFSIVDILDHLYGHVLNINPENLNSPDRDYFILSKGHGCGAFYSVLHKYGFLSSQDLIDYSTSRGILGGHPDSTKVPGAEASTGSLGHGFPTAVGIALGLKIKKENNNVFALLGDGECQEGTIWEAANIAANQKLNNLCAIVDWNGSAAQLLPIDDLPMKWKAFGWEVYEIDGHSSAELEKTFTKIADLKTDKPKVVLARTIKGQGVSITKGHGPWHHKIPNDEEMAIIMKELSQ